MNRPWIRPRLSLSLCCWALLLGGCQSAADRFYAQGEQALAAGNAVRAMVAFNHARALRPDQLRYHTGAWRARARFLAESAERVTTDNQEDSRFELDQLLAAEPHNAVYLTALAHVQAHAGELEEARRSLDEAVKADGRSVLALSARAALLSRSTSKVDDALAAWGAVVAVSPDSFAAHLALGRLYLLKKDSAREVDELRTAQRLDPRSYAAAEALGDAYLHAAQGARADDERQARLLDAFKAFGQAASLSPESAEPHWGLAMIQIQAARWAQAEQELRAAMKGRRRPEMDLQLGLAVARQGRCLEAIPMFQLFLREEPEHPAALLELGAWAASLGRRDEALGYYRRLLGLPVPPEGDGHRAEALLRNRLVEARVAALTGKPEKKA